jgi:hypothetical protein
MPKGLTLKLEIPQKTVRVDVEFYDEVEKGKLLRYPNHKSIDGLAKSGLEIPTEEFLTYYLFHKKRPGKVGWRNHKEIGRKIGNALAELDEWIDFDGESISTPANVVGQDKAITERIGESIGLSVISHDMRSVLGIPQWHLLSKCDCVPGEQTKHLCNLSYAD